MTENQYGSPVLLSAGKLARPLVRLALTQAAEADRYSEDWLQELVFTQPGCLPTGELDAAYDELIPVCRELSTAAGPVDVLFVTPSGRLVILEAKLWRNPEARRKVIGQILDYAKEVSRWSYEDLQAEIGRRTKRTGNALYQIVAERFPEVGEAWFVDQVTRGLHFGRFMLLIVGDGIREGAGAIADFLQQYASLDFSFGLVELAVYRVGPDDLLVQPRILAKALTIKRSIVALEYGQLSISEANDEAQEDVQPSDTWQFYSRFWSDFLAGLRLTDPRQPMAKPRGRGNIYFEMPPGSSQAWITVFFSQDQKKVGVFLTFARGPFGDEAYERLLADREEIEKELSVPVEWFSEDGKHRIATSASFPDLKAETHRSAITTYLADGLNRFVGVFRPRLARISEEI